MSINKTTEQFIQEAKAVHGDRYIYDEHTVYFMAVSKITITCREHGRFITTPSIHLGGSQCPKCARGPRYTQAEYIQKLQELYGDQYLYDKTVYTLSKNPVTVTCPVHGDFSKSANSMLRYGCFRCGADRSRVNRTFTTEQYIEIATKVHNDRFSYPRLKYINFRHPVTVTYLLHNSLDNRHC